jgi:hypothetical protein
MHFGIYVKGTARGSLACFVGVRFVVNFRDLGTKL